MAKKGYLLLFITCLVFLTVCTPASALEVNRKTLPNGLTVLHVERHNLPLVMVTILVKAGSFDESEDRAGLAYLVSSVLTEGTESRTSSQISEEVEFIGAELGASAGKDYSAVTLSVLKKDVEKGFDLLSDVLLNPSFPEEEIQRKKELIKGSLKQDEEDPGFLASRAFLKEVYGDYPYGRLVRGSPETIDRVSREDILGFYSGYYRPNNSIFAVAGDLTPEELDSLLDGFFSGWKQGMVPERKTPALEPPGKKVVTIDRDVTQADIALGHLGVRRDNPDFYPLLVMNYILGGGGFSSRLMESIRDEMGLAYSVYSSFGSNREPGIFRVRVQTKNESAKTVIEEILRQMRRIRQEKVSEEELQDAKAYLVGSLPMRLDTMKAVAGFIARVEYHGLGTDFVERFTEYINAVTREDVQRVAEKYLHPEKYVLVIVADLSEAGLGAD
jgi:zinc protease